MKLSEVTTDTFDEEVLRAKMPVLVDFWGPQCGPCLALMPGIEVLAEDRIGQLTVAKVNAAENRRLCIRLRVMGLPTVLLFKNGQENGRLTGTVTLEQVHELAEKACAGAHVS